MAYNWSKFPKKDKLSHSKVLSEQRYEIRKSFHDAKSKDEAKYLEWALNTAFYGQGRNIKSNQDNMSEAEQNYYNELVQAIDIILEEKFRSKVKLN